MKSFLDLPAEIRLQIYHYLFVDNDGHLLLHLELSKTYLAPRHGGIVCVSKQCYEETAVLHTESLTHLIVEYDRFGLFKPVHRPYESTRPYERMFGHAFDCISRSPNASHHLKLLKRIRKLTVPSFISGYHILLVNAAGVLPSLATISYMSTDLPTKDVCPTQPFLPSNAEHDDVSSDFYYGRRRTSHGCREWTTRQFVPSGHLGWSSWAERDALQRLAGRRGFRVLWTGRVIWQRQRQRQTFGTNEVDETEPVILYQSPGVRPLCQTIEFVSLVFSVFLFHRHSGSVLWMS